ncbi:MAG: subclass B3 metallo-beta-lactamase [Bryobacteraceae bacterium]
MKLTFSLLAIFGFSSICQAATPPEWSRPFPPHRIAPNIYYVGTEDLACYLITDAAAGHILINTGLADSVPLINASIEKLGFRVKDIRILLTNQAHYDHVAAFAEFRRLSGAKVFATPGDAPLLESGGAADPGDLPRFVPVHVDRVLKDGEVVRLGKVALTVRSTPGHTPGSVSYETTVDQDGRSLNFLFANIATVVMPLVNPKYPGIVADFESTFTRQHAMKPDIWVAGHASQFHMQEKFKAKNFVDPQGFASAVAASEKAFRERVQKELPK